MQLVLIYNNLPFVINQLKFVMEENVVNNPEKSDVLGSWKRISAIILSSTIALLGYKSDLGGFYSLLLFIPVIGLLNGFFDNQPRKILENILMLVIFPMLTGNRDNLYGTIADAIPPKMGIWTVKCLFYFSAATIFFIIKAVAALTSKLLPPKPLPPVIHRIGMIIIFSLVLVGSICLVYLGLEYCDGRFISIPGAVSFLLPLILAFIGMFALKKMVKLVLNPESYSPEANSKDTSCRNYPDITLDDVAGMEEVKQQIRLRMIEPLRNPGEARKYGLKKGGGIMLYGPPGTGKTFLARAVAGELKIPFYMITAADVFSKYVGESEQKIKELFDNARKNPLSVIFIDEMEIFFSRRTDNIHEVTRKIISLILQELDGVDNNKNPFLLLGATNTPWQIDEAFLRPGRFDVHAFVDLPDAAARKQILSNAFKSGKLKYGEDFLDYLVAETGSFSGADLSGLAMAIRQAAFEGKATAYSTELAATVLKKFSASAKSDIITRINEWRKANGETGNQPDKGNLADRPDTRLADVAGMEEVKKQIRLRLIEPVRNPELAAKYGLKKGGGVMLYGPPGTGKTFLARAIAGELELPFYTITAADIFAKNVGESEQNVRKIFADARKNPLSVIFVDEMEAVFSSREQDIHEVSRKVISIILQELDGVDNKKNPFLLLGAINTPWQIDEAFLRPGRFDVHAFVGLPDVAARKQILAHAFKFSSLPQEPGLLDYIAGNTGEYSGADLTGLVTAIRQQAFENLAESYTLQLAYEVMLRNRPASKQKTLARIREWENTRKQPF